MKRFLKTALKGCGIVCVLFLAFLVFVVAPRIQTKTEAAHSSLQQKTRIDELRPEMQFESHTCGLHAMRTLYKAYGIDPDQENLRFRLGVDVKSNPVDPTSTGTVHPDIYRVLEQDGFEYRQVMQKNESDTEAMLRKHLNERHPALFLIALPVSGNMHWVVATDLQENDLMVMDSLSPNPVRKNISDFLHEEVLSCILVQPSDTPAERDSYTVFYGVGDMKAALQRLALLQSRRNEVVR